MIFDLLELKEWTPVDDIIIELKEKYDIGVSRRTLRKERERANEKFYNHESDYCIARSNLGYKKTKKEEDIIQSEQADLAMALDLLKKYHSSKRARVENINMNLKIENNKLIFIENERK